MFSSRFLIGFLIFILSVHTLATVRYWYWTIWWFDIPMHFFGGFWAAVVFVWFINKYFPQISQLHNFLSSLIAILSFVALIGVLWEFAEFLFDVFISSGGYAKIVQQDAADTLGDLLFDLLGGLTVAVIFLTGKNKANSAE